LMSELRSLVEGIYITREFSPRTRDAFLAHGESFTLAIVYSLLADAKVAVRSFDARSIIVTNDEFSHAKPILDLTSARIRSKFLPTLRKGEVALTQGFVGATRDGVTTTMGSESSDLTATLIAR